MSVVGMDMEDDLPALLESVYANATMASGETDLQTEAYRQFCKELASLESILKAKGVLPEAAIEE